MQWQDRTLAEMSVRGISQTEMADLIGYSQSGFNRIITGQRQARLEVIQRVAKSLGRSVEYLLHGIERGDAPSLQISVPILKNATDVASWLSTPELITASTNRWIGCPIDSVGTRTYAYHASSPDMASPLSPGALVYLDPDDDANPDGSDAVLYITDSGPILRMAARVAGSTYLQATNPAFPPITVQPSDVFAGVAVGILINNRRS